MTRRRPVTLKFFHWHRETDPFSDLTFISLKITATEELYEKVMSSHFWSTGVDIREFDYRPRKTAGHFL